MKDLGTIVKMSIDIDKPLKITYDMEFQSLCLLVGLNGSGKSLMLKLHWALQTVMATVINARTSKLSLDTKAVSQEVMNGTFTDQNFNGRIIAYFENGTLEIILENGTVTKAGYDTDPQVEQIAVPIFMSAGLRKFTEIDKYLKLEKIVGTEKMIEMYRLYDIVFVERMKHFLIGGFATPQSFKDSMKKFDGMEKFDFTSFSIENESVYFLDKKGNKKQVASLSDGEQSLINMMLSNSFNS